MDISNKIELQRKEILNNSEKNLDRFLNQADSPIEKLMLQYIIRYLTTTHNYRFCNTYNYFGDDGNENFIFSSRIHISKLHNTADINDPKKYKLKYLISVVPQLEEYSDDNKYSIDIAIKLRTFQNDGTFIKENKVAIECDGHDFHSNKIQIEKDNKRARSLRNKDWCVLRYSGSEIYNFNYKIFSEKIFTDILHILFESTKDENEQMFLRLWRNGDFQFINSSYIYDFKE
ncbi:hypothetical protein [Leeuwenhoekiella sp. LLG6367-2.1]|uniref:hypothetical protein n=1 Tax=Leeuwenhoekiella sp. LLG6367-2.1 TaxID=3160833 RepID=UPI003867CDBB